MKKHIGWLLLLCVLSLGTALADAAYINGKTADRVHLRSQASMDAESLGLFYTGTEVAADVNRLGDEWVRVSIGSQNGYIMGQYLQADPPVCEVPSASVNASTLNFRAKPTKDSNAFDVLKQGELLTVWGETANGWYYAENARGATGYVMPQYLAMAEPENQNSSEIKQVGETHNGYRIFRYVAPNGQTLYFTGLDDPFVKMEDVNFDGQDDLVFNIIRGASNFFVEFFVWDGNQYVRAENDAGADGIVNYALYPQQGLVMSSAQNGYAGALFENILYRWQGTDLKIIRRSVSQEQETYTDTDEGFTIAFDQNTLHVRVWDYQNGVANGELTYETRIDLDELNDSDSYHRLFADEQAAFWQGIQ